MPSFPSVDFTDCSVSSNTPTLVTKSINGVEERATIAGQYWTVGATFRNLSDSERRQLIGFIMKSRGPYSTFDLTLPTTLDDSTGNYTGTITVATATAGNLSFTATVSASNTLILKAGDFIKFSNHNKVYMVTDDATSVGTNLTVSLYPAIRTSATSSHTVTHKNVPMTVRFATDNIPFSLDQKLFSSVDIDFIEVL
jgi:hypothetical protein